MSFGNVADLVGQAAGRVPDRPALVCGEDTLTWRMLETQVSGLAGVLAAAHPVGARIGLLLPNGTAFAIAYFAVLRAGLVAVPLNPAYTEAEIGHQLADAEVGLVITDDLRAGLVAGTQVLLVGTGAWDEAVRAPAAESRSRGDDDLAVLLYTSGTTGRPKGAMLSHRALLANLDQLAGISPPVVAADDVVLLVLPLFHVYALNAGLGMTARVGATGVLADRFEPVETLTLVREQRITNVIGAPPMFVAWSMLPELAESLSSVRLAVSGAAPLPPEVLADLLSSTGRHLYEGYGLTETAPVLTTTLCSASVKPGSIGRPVPGVELRLLDDYGDEVEDDDPGEIVVRGPNLFSGYWPDGSGGPDDEGWFRTGDVAYADEDGDLFLVDRKRELILVSGFNVYPREVEGVIATHPDVAEVAVLGVAHPYTGETVRALVVPRPGSAPTSESIIEHAAKKLARFKCPTSVEFVAELPHSATGKVAKGQLR